MPDNPFGEEVFLNIRSKPSLMQFELVAQPDVLHCLFDFLSLTITLLLSRIPLYFGQFLHVQMMSQPAAHCSFPIVVSHEW